MEQKGQKQIDESKSARSWVRPELVRLEAGAAEFGDVSNTDAQPGFS